MVWGAEKKAKVAVGFMTAMATFAFLVFDFDFFFHVYFLAVFVIELILQEAQLLAGYDFDAKPIFHLPFPFQRNQPLVDICCDVWMYV